MANLLKPALFLQLANLVTQYGIKNLVETGTGPNSSGMEAAARLGLRGYTCDVLDSNAVHASEQYPDFDCYHGDSISMLKDCLPNLTGPTFFFLDAHCPDDPASLPAGVFPLYEEMQTIRELKTGYAQDVIWCDDVTMIVDRDNPIRSDWTRVFRGEAWTGEREHSWKEYLAVFADTHSIELDNDEGLLELKPGR